DAKNVHQHLVQKSDVKKELDEIQIVNEAAEQIGFADKIIINKTDLVAPDEIHSLESTIKQINPYAEIMKSRYSQVDINKILDIRSFELDRVLKKDPGSFHYLWYRYYYT